MNIALNESRTNYLREAFHQIKTVQEQTECIVPDVLEDVGQIVSAQAQLCLKSKEISEHAAAIGVSAEISVFYITESRGCVRCLNLSRDLEIGFDSPAIEADAAACVSICCLGVQARSVNPRKIAAQLSVRAELSCWTEDRFCIPIDTAEDGGKGLQLQMRAEDSVWTERVAEKSFVVSEQLSLDAEEGPTALSVVRARLLSIDRQPLGGKLLLKGSAEIVFGFETQEGSTPRFTERSVPFSVLVDMPDEDAIPGDVIFEPTSIYADLGDAINGSRVVELELHAVAQLRFDRRETIRCLSDAYSTLCPISAEMSEAVICRSRSKETLSLRTTDRFPLEPERGVVISVFSDILSFSVRDGKAALSASVSLLLCSEEGTYSAVQRLLSFEEELPQPEGEIISARITAIRAERAGEEIAVTAAAVIEFARCETTTLRYLSAIELEPERAYDLSALPSLTIARRGERDFWELAKLYHSSPDAIERMAQAHPMEGDLLLIPRA